MFNGWVHVPWILSWGWIPLEMSVVRFLEDFSSSSVRPHQEHRQVPGFRKARRPHPSQKQKTLERHRAGFWGSGKKSQQLVGSLGQRGLQAREQKGLS